MLQRSSLPPGAGEVKSTGCSSRGPGFNSQHPHGSSQPSITVVSAGTAHTKCIDTYTKMFTMSLKTVPSTKTIPKEQQIRPENKDSEQRTIAKLREWDQGCDSDKRNVQPSVECTRDLTQHQEKDFYSEYLASKYIDKTLMELQDAEHDWKQEESLLGSHCHRAWYMKRQPDARWQFKVKMDEIRKYLGDEKHMVTVHTHHHHHHHHTYTRRRRGRRGEEERGREEGGGEGEEEEEEEEEERKKEEEKEEEEKEEEKKEGRREKRKKKKKRKKEEEKKKEVNHIATANDVYFC
ncbi:hypothetical protein STEG23_009294 [Scotinomys teguina]